MNPDGAIGYLAGTFSYSTSASLPDYNTFPVSISAKDIYGNLGQATATVTVLCNPGQSNTPQATQSVYSAARPSVQSFPSSYQLDSEIKAGRILISPNPTAGRFSFKLSNVNVPKIDVEIMSGRGAIITRRSVRGIIGGTFKTDFDLSKHPAGLYLIKTFDGHGEIIGSLFCSIKLALFLSPLLSPINKKVGRILFPADFFHYDPIKGVSSPTLFFQLKFPRPRTLLHNIIPVFPCLNQGQL
jgi:hypothetical protein